MRAMENILQLMLPQVMHSDLLFRVMFHVLRREKTKILFFYGGYDFIVFKSMLLPNFAGFIREVKKRLPLIFP
jgi:hypothetical protein